MEKCYFCGEKTSGKTFIAVVPIGENKTYPVCDNCDGPDLHEDEETK